MTLENFILEQEINTTSVDDILMEQAIADFEVACAILECYNKNDILMEYASSDASEFGVFQEGVVDKIKEGAKKAGHAVATALKKGWDMLLRAVENFLNIFRKVDFGHMASVINKYPADTTFNVNMRPFSVLSDTFDYASRLAEKMANGNTDTETYKTLKDHYATVVKNLREQEDMEENLSMSDLTKEIISVGKQSSYFGVGQRNLRKAIDFDHFVENNDVPKETVSEITEMIKMLTNTYMMSAKTLKKLMNIYASQGNRHNKEIDDRVKSHEKSAHKQKNAYKKDKDKDDSPEDQDEA